MRQRWLRWNDRLSMRVADWLAHPAGFAYFNAFSVAWFALPYLAGALAWRLFGIEVAVGTAFFVRVALPSYLDVVTWFSGATQFTVVYQGRLGEAHMLKLMRLVVALAEEIKRGQQELLDEFEDDTD